MPPNPDADLEPDPGTPPESGHNKPPLLLMFLWILFVGFTFYYLYTYMLPDLKKWLH